MDRSKKGKVILSLPNDYTIVDLETTGLEWDTDYIIEFAALKVRDGKEIARFQSLIKPPVKVAKPIQKLTGITNEMLQYAPSFKQIAEKIWNFLEGEFLIGHSINFDVTFLFDAFQNEDNFPIFTNNFMDTLPLSQKLFPELIHHRLIDMASYYKIDTNMAHRALADCIMNYKIFECMKQTVLISYDDFDSFLSKWNTLEKRLHSSSVSTSVETFDPSHPLYGKVCVITGALNSMSRKEAMQHIADVGGKNCDKLNTLTNILILGNASYCDLLTGISKKHKKALRLIDEGHSLQIITESDFCSYLKP